eukprot:g28750.t1
MTSEPRKSLDQGLGKDPLKDAAESARTPRRMRSGGQAEPKSSSLKKKKQVRPEPVQTDIRLDSSAKSPRRSKDSSQSPSMMLPRKNSSPIQEGLLQGPDRRERSVSPARKTGSYGNILIVNGNGASKPESAGREGVAGPGRSAPVPDLSNVQLPKPKPRREKKKKKKKRISINGGVKGEEVDEGSDVEDSQPVASLLPAAQIKQPTPLENAQNGEVFMLPTQLPGATTSPSSGHPVSGFMSPPLLSEVQTPREMEDPFPVRHGDMYSPISPDYSDGGPPFPDMPLQQLGQLQAPVNSRPPHKLVRFHASPAFGLPGPEHAAGPALPYVMAAPVPSASVPAALPPGLGFPRSSNGPALPEQPAYPSPELVEMERQAKERLEMEERVFKRKQVRLDKERVELEELRRELQAEREALREQREQMESKHADATYNTWNGKGGQSSTYSPERNLPDSPPRSPPPRSHAEIEQEQKRRLEEAVCFLRNVPSILRPPPLLPDGEVDEAASEAPFQPSQLLNPPAPCFDAPSCSGAGCVVLCAKEVDKTRVALSLLQRIIVTATKQHQQMEEIGYQDGASPLSVSRASLPGALLTPHESPAKDQKYPAMSKSMSNMSNIQSFSNAAPPHPHLRSFSTGSFRDSLGPRGHHRMSSSMNFGPGHMRRATSGSFPNITDANDPTGECVMEGYLLKKASKKFVGWQQRYFNLYPSLLTYSASKGGIVLSRIPTKFIKYITIPDKSKAPTTLQMLAEVPRWGKKEFWLKAHSAVDADKWEKIIWKMLERREASSPDVFILPDRRGSKKQVPFKDVVVGPAAAALSEAELGPAESFYRLPAPEGEPQGALLLSGQLKMKKMGLVGGWVTLQAELRQSRLIFFKESTQKPADSFALLSLTTVYRDERQPTDFTVVKDPSIGGGTLVLRATDAPIAEKWVKELLASIQDLREVAESKVRTRAIIQGPLQMGVKFRLDVSLESNFQSRWFQLFNNCLVSFKTSDVRVRPVRSFPLEDIAAVWSDERNLSVFSLVVIQAKVSGPVGAIQESVTVLEASDPDNCLEWINNVRNQIFKFKLMTSGLTQYKFPTERTREGNIADIARKNNLPASHNAQMMTEFSVYRFFLPNDPEYIKLNEQVNTGETCIKEATVEKLIEWITLAHEDHFNTRFDFLLTYTSFLTHEELAQMLLARACMPLEVPGTGLDKVAANEWRLNEVAPVQRKVFLTVLAWVNLLSFEGLLEPTKQPGGRKPSDEAGAWEEHARTVGDVLDTLLGELARCAVTEGLLQIAKMLQRALQTRRESPAGAKQEGSLESGSPLVAKEQKDEHSVFGGWRQATNRTSVIGPQIEGPGSRLESFARTQTNKPEAPALSSNSGPNFDFDLENVIELARQLAVRDYAHFSRIRFDEFIHRAWQSEEKLIKAPNLVKTTAQFNNLVHWAQGLILKPKDPRTRALRIAKLIRVAEKCQQIRAYPSFFALFTALTSDQCQSDRLKQTWKLVPKATHVIFDGFHKIFNVERNHRAFRTELGRAKRPAVPFIGTFLSDLFQVDETQKDKTKEGLVNFQKMRLLAKTIGYLKQFQVEPFNYQPVDYIQSYFDNALQSVMSEEDLMKMSKEVEP